MTLGLKVTELFFQENVQNMFHPDPALSWILCGSVIDAEYSGSIEISKFCGKTFVSHQGGFNIRRQNNHLDKLLCYLGIWLSEILEK